MIKNGKYADLRDNLSSLQVNNKKISKYLEQMSSNVLIPE